MGRTTAAQNLENTAENAAQEPQENMAEATPSIKTARFAPLESGSTNTSNTIDLLYDVQLELSVELGRATMPVREVLQLGPGSVIELDKLGGEPVDVLVNGRLIARGEVVVVDENFGVRITELITSLATQST